MKTLRKAIYDVMYWAWVSTCTALLVAMWIVMYMTTRGAQYLYTTVAHKES